MLKQTSKLKAIWSVFATQKVIFNWKKVLNSLKTSNITKIRAIIAKKSKTFIKKNKK